MKMLDDITSFIFIEGQATKSRHYFYTRRFMARTSRKKAAELWKEGYAPYVFPGRKV